MKNALKTRIPGETALENFEKSKELGEVDIDDNIYNKLQEYISLNKL